MMVAACQPPVVMNDTERALSLVELHSMDAQRRGAKLICFPEAFLQGYDVRAEHVRNVALDLESADFSSILRRLDGIEPVIVLGLIEKRSGSFFNTAAVIARGNLVARYRKAHLIGNEQAVFERGSDHCVFDVAGVKVGINVCYDLQFPESAAAASEAGAELLACPCNNLLRPTTAEEWKLRHNQIRSERAREARVWILSSDVTGEHEGRISYGPTALIDPEGTVVAQVPLMTTGLLVVEPHIERLAPAQVIGN